jgi:hypothetical protein
VYVLYRDDRPLSSRRHTAGVAYTVLVALHSHSTAVHMIAILEHLVNVNDKKAGRRIHI